MIAQRSAVAVTNRNLMRVINGQSVLRPYASACAQLLETHGEKKPNLVILGTGWGSFRVLSDIDPEKYNISVVSPRNHLLFTPMLASSAVGTVQHRSICQPVRPVVAGKGGKFYESSVSKIDKKNKRVLAVTERGDEYFIPFDKLVVGVGFQPNDFGTPGVKEHAFFMKETADATVFKDHVLRKLEEASYIHALDGDFSISPEEEKQIRELLTFVVVGGGPTGVELSAELTDFLKEGKGHYSHLSEYISVHMFTYDILNTFDQNLQEHAIAHLKNKQQVHVNLGYIVQKVEKDIMYVKAVGSDNTESIRYGTLVWCAGVKPHKFVTDYGFQMNERGTQILTETNLRVKGEDGIYALGDCATIDGNWLPQTAQVANQQAQFLAKHLNKGNIDKAGDFAFESKGIMAYLGGANAVMHKLPVPGPFKDITGFLAFLGWRSTYWFLQLSMRNRYMIFTDWARTFIFGRDLTRFGNPSQLA